MKRRRADAFVVDTTSQAITNGNRSTTPESLASISWDNVIIAFTNEFHSLYDVQVRNRKVHLDFCEEPCKTIDSPNDNWISVLIIDALIYYVNNDKKKRVRRSFNQHQVLADAIWDCYMNTIRTMSVMKGPSYAANSSTSSLISNSNSSGSSRMTRQRVSANVTENSENKFKLILPTLWSSFNALKDSLHRNAPRTRKPGRRYTNSIKYYCSHPILRQHKHDSLRHLICHVVKEILQSRYNALYRSKVTFQLITSPAETERSTRSSSNKTRESSAISPDDPTLALMFNEITNDDKHAENLFQDDLALFSVSNDSFAIPSCNEVLVSTFDSDRSLSLGNSSSSSSKHSHFSPKGQN